MTAKTCIHLAKICPLKCFWCITETFFVIHTKCLQMDINLDLRDQPLILLDLTLWAQSCETFEHLFRHLTTFTWLI